MGYAFSKLQELDQNLTLELNNKNMEYLGISSLDIPRVNCLAFLKEKKYLKKVNFDKFINIYSEMGLVVCKNVWENLSDSEKNKIAKTFLEVILSEKINNSMSMLSKLYYDQDYGRLNNFIDARQVGTADIHPEAKISQNVFIGESSVIEQGVVIYPGCVIMGKVIVKKGTTLFPNCVVYSNVEIGENCRIHAGTIIGADGFGYYFEAGKHHKFWHLGGVLIGNETEIGAGCTIDSGTFSETRIGNNVIIDDQVHLAHNCQIEDGVILCGQVGLAGSAQVGRYSVLGGKSGMVPDTKLGEQCQVGGNSMITRDWAPKSILAGHPAINLKTWLKTNAYIRRLIEKK
jgi:UDP-3-O-[3-hydroxymyristoyl] glucosamine N-acyltransferase